MEKFPDIDHLHCLKIHQKLNQGLSIEETTVGLISGSMCRTLSSFQDYPMITGSVNQLQKAFLKMTQKQHALADNILNNNAEKLLDNLCTCVQQHCDDNSVNNILERKEALLPLLLHYHQTFQKCEELSRVKGITEQQTDQSHVSVTTKARIPKPHEDNVMQWMASNRANFTNNVLSVPSHISGVRKGCIVLEFKVEDMWDAENVQLDVSSGMFQARLVTWLRENGIEIDKDEVKVEITSIRQEKGPLKKDSDPALGEASGSASESSEASGSSSESTSTSVQASADTSTSEQDRAPDEGDSTQDGKLSK